MKLMRAKPLKITSVENFWIVLLVVFLPELDRSCIWCDKDDTTKKWTQRSRKDWSGQSLEKKHSRVWKLQVKVTQIIESWFHHTIKTLLRQLFKPFLPFYYLFYQRGGGRRGNEGRQCQIANYQHVIRGFSVLHSCNGGDMSEQSMVLAGWLSNLCLRTDPDCSQSSEVPFSSNQAYLQHKMAFERPDRKGLIHTHTQKTTNINFLGNS